MKVRVISGVAVALLMLALVWAGGHILGAGMCIIAVIAFTELTKALKVREEGKLCLLDYIGIIGTVGYYLMLFLYGYKPSFELIFIMLTILFIGLMMAYVICFPKFNSKQITGAFLAFMYAPLMLSFVVLTRAITGPMDNGFYTTGFFVVWIAFICCWGSDTCAYFVGVLIGKHKIFPRLSPKKTVEGCLGGLVGAALLNYLYAYILYRNGLIEFQSTFVFIGIGLVGSLVGQIGDLAASAIKRDNDIKDYGRIIPGHGGIMDRFDSLVMMAPIVFIVARLFF